MTLSVAALQLPEPSCDFRPDLVWTAFLQKVRSGSHVDGFKVLDILLRPGEVLGGDERAWPGVKKELRQCRFLQPFAVCRHGIPYVRRFSADRRFSGESPDRDSAHAFFERFTVIVHLLLAKGPAGCLRQELQ